MEEQFEEGFKNCRDQVEAMIIRGEPVDISKLDLSAKVKTLSNGQKFVDGKIGAGSVEPAEVTMGGVEKEVIVQK